LLKRNRLLYPTNKTTDTSVVMVAMARLSIAPPLLHLPLQFAWYSLAAVNAAQAGCAAGEIRPWMYSDSGADEGDCAAPGDSGDFTMLFQVPMSEILLSQQHQPIPKVAEVMERPNIPFPLSWLHVPKSGSSFINALVDLPGACRFPHDITIDANTFGESQLANFQLQYPVSKYCPGSFSATFFLGAHTGLGSAADYVADVWEGHGVTMIRQPEQRILSAYHHKYHSWPLAEMDGRYPRDELEFAQTLQGCVTRMLTRSGSSYTSHVDPNWIHWGGPCGGPERATSKEKAEAIRRLTSFAFVGLTDKWELSMCLFHRVFGGRCRESDFVNSRHAKGDPSEPSPATHYDAESLQGWTDPDDAELYRTAVELFTARAARHNVSEESCRPCYDEAGIAH